MLSTYNTNEFSDSPGRRLSPVERGTPHTSPRQTAVEDTPSKALARDFEKLSVSENIQTSPALASSAYQTPPSRCAPLCPKIAHKLLSERLGSPPKSKDNNFHSHDHNEPVETDAPI